MDHTASSVEAATAQTADGMVALKLLCRGRSGGERCFLAGRPAMSRTLHAFAADLRPAAALAGIARIRSTDSLPHPSNAVSLTRLLAEGLKTRLP